MESGKQFNALLQVLSGEQQVIQRTDQKAFTLLSILGVFMVFFIVHFPKIQMNLFNFLMMIIYFTSAMGTIYYLVQVIVPRVRKHKTKIEDKEVGQKISGGEVICWIGDRHENGGWDPHLHFQLSWSDPGTHDMPGVVNPADREEALAKYPDPRMVMGPIY